MDYSRLNLLIVAISCFAVLAFSIFVTGCGSDGDDDDDDVIAPDPNPVSDPDPQPDPEPEPQPEPEPEPEGVSFQADILPILQASCAVQGCHVAPNPRGGLNLETYAGFEKGGFGGPAFNPGNSKNSDVVRRIEIGDMPRRGGKLPDEQIQLFRDWIDEGAKDN